MEIVVPFLSVTREMPRARHTSPYVVSKSFLQTGSFTLLDHPPVLYTAAPSPTVDAVSNAANPKYHVSMKRCMMMVCASASAIQLSAELRALASRSIHQAQIVRGRATKDDVDRISWGKPAKQRGTGSRGVPHRLNQAERQLFDIAKAKGYVEIAGSGWRTTRRDAPLVNTWRLWCDAIARPAIFVHKPTAIVLDLSPLRVSDMDQLVTALSAERFTALEGSACSECFTTLDGPANAELDREPIHRLPRLDIMCTVDTLADAKTSAKLLVELFEWPILRRRVPSKRPINIKPGASRRHGGYGIG